MTRKERNALQLLRGLMAQRLRQDRKVVMAARGFVEALISYQPSDAEVLNQLREIRKAERKQKGGK